MILLFLELFLFRFINENIEIRYLLEITSIKSKINNNLFLNAHMK